MLQIVLGQDGDVITEEIKKFNLGEADKKYSKKQKNYILDFVGFIIEKEKILAVFPKHFFNEDNKLNNQSSKDIEKNVIQSNKKI